MADTEVTLRFKGDATSAVRAAGQTDAALGRIGGRSRVLGRAFLALGAVAAGGLAFGLGKALSLAGDFEASLNTFQAVSSATGDEMERVSALSKQLGADLTLPGTSAKDAADAMTELAKGGLSVRDAMNAARGTLQLSAAAQIENAEAATIVADALNAFNLAGDQAGKVADLLAASANATTAEMGDMAAALKQSSAVAAQLGIPIEEVVTELGELANAGIKGSDAGTSLRTMLLRLGAPTAQAKEALDDLGVSVFTARGEMRSMPDIIEQFSRATRGMSDEQRTAAFQTIFGTDAIRAANIVLRGGLKPHDEMAKAVGRQGAAADLAAAKMRGYKGALEGFKSTVETFAITIGEKLLPVATSVVGQLSDMVGFLDKVASAKSPTVAVRILFEGVKSAVSTLVDSIRGALFGTGGFKPLKLDSGKIIELTDERHPAFVDRLQDAILGADWPAIGAKIGRAIGSAISFSADALDGILTAITDWVGSHIDELADLGAQLIAGIFVKITDPGFWIEHWRLALAVALGVLGLFFTPARFAKSGILVRAISGLFAGVLPRVARFIGRLAADFLRGIGGRAGAAAERGAARLVARVITWISQLPARVERYLAITAQGIGAKVGSWAAAAGRLGKAVIDAVVRWISNLPGRVGDLITRTAVAIGMHIADFARNAYALGQAIVSGIINGMGGLFSQVAGFVKDQVASAISWVAGHLGSTAEEYAARQLGHPLAEGVAGGFESRSRDLRRRMAASLRDAIPTAGGTALGGAAVAASGGGGLTVHVPIHFHGPVGEPERFARQVAREVERQVRRGGSFNFGA